MFEEFYLNGTRCKGMKSAFIFLVPKKDTFSEVSNYRLVSLVTSAYKIITKVLLIQLSEVLDDTVSLNRSAFLGDRQILNVSLVANEVVEYTW